MDRTVEFRQCLLINSNSFKIPSKPRNSKAPQPIQLNEESKSLLDNLNNVNNVINSIDSSTNLAVLDEEISSILKLSSSRLKLLDDKIEQSLSTSYVDTLLGQSSNPVHKQHQYGKLISLNAFLFKLSHKYQKIQQSSSKKHKIIPQYAQLEDVDIPTPSTNHSHLSPQQTLLLEKESEALRNSDKQDLIALEKAQHSLLSITNLQSEIMTHLTQQSHLVEQLYDDSLTSTGSLGDASKQLFKAKDNQSSSRLFIIFFFFIAGFSLLFLEFYD
ncbi:hypothetical protein E3P98_01823 [Wallemia ichthyophaga]|nr:hypothetical protein E3P98_01823 [Wallemia ichthyophaga]